MGISLPTCTCTMLERDMQSPAADEGFFFGGGGGVGGGGNGW